jgi:hypothetical protein
MNIFEKIRQDYQFVKEKKKKRKIMINDISIYFDNKRKLENEKIYVNDTKIKIEKELDNIINKKDSYIKQMNAENFLNDNIIDYISFKIFPKNCILFVLLKKSKKLLIMKKRIDKEDGITIKHEKKEYKVISQYLVQSGRFQMGFWLEDKLEQLNPSYMDKTPITSQHFVKISNQKLIDAVFNPREENKSGFNWILLAGIGIAILLILHFTGVIDLVEIFNSLKNMIIPSAAQPPVNNTFSGEIIQ